MRRLCFICWRVLISDDEQRRGWCAHCDWKRDHDPDWYERQRRKHEHKRKAGGDA